MIEIREILCPVDLSEHSRHALDHAIALARWYKSTVTVLHVSAVLPVSAYAPGAAGFQSVVLTPADRDQLLAEMTRFVAPGASPDVPLQVITRTGDAAAEILAQAGEMHAGLVVIGTHGHSGFVRFLLGSVTEKVLRRAECPVLTVPPRAPGTSRTAPITYKRLLCPVDFSDSSMQALRYATSVAQEADAQLTVLHVMEYDMHETPELYDTVISDARLSIPEFRARCREISRERLDAVISDEVRTYCTVETLLTDGKSYREVLRVAAEKQSDLIVMGVRGRGAVDLMVFGSTTQHVIRQATCAVLTLRGT